MNATFLRFESSNGTEIFRIPLQVFPNFWSFAYLLHNSEFNILIDAGSATDTSHEDMRNGLKQAGLEPMDLTVILLTHAHIDHYGGLSRIKPLTNAKIACHTLDLQTVTQHEGRQALTIQRLTSFLADSGLAAGEADMLINIYRSTKALSQSVPVDFTYETLGEHIPGMDVIHLPGHCPGHVALKFDDVIFCGDMVVEGVTPHLTPGYIHPHNGLDPYLESLERLQAWAEGIPFVLNGHDDIITDLPSKISAARENIVRRMSRAMNALAEPLTTAEVCKIVYENPQGYNQFLTMEKSGAYIEYLYEHAMIKIANPGEVESGSPARYVRLREIPDNKLLPGRDIATAGKIKYP